GFNDPFNNQPVPTTITVVPVGESPIVFLANRSDTSGLGTTISGVPYYSNVFDYVAQGGGYVTKLGKLFQGKDCTGESAAFSSEGYLVQPGAAAAAGQSLPINQINDPAADGSLKFIFNEATAPASLVAGAWVTVTGSTSGTYDSVYQI